MATYNCEEVISNKIDAIISAFKINHEQETKRITTCLYNCFKPGFIKWAQVMYNKYDNDLILFIADSAFTDAVMLFSKKAESGEIYKGTATLKTILFTIYKNKLLSHLQTEIRVQKKNNKLSSDPNNEAYLLQPFGEEQDMGKDIKIFEKALLLLEPKDRQVIILRHVEGKSCDEIAAILGINVASTHNRIYRCMERLKSIIRQIVL